MLYIISITSITSIISIIYIIYIITITIIHQLNIRFSIIRLLEDSLMLPLKVFIPWMKMIENR